MKRLAFLSILLLTPNLSADAPAHGLRSKLLKAGITYETPVFLTRENLSQMNDIDPDLKELLDFLLRKIPDGKKRGEPFSGRTCAIVGNSGNLRGSRYGSAIDAHDVVLRMNDAVVKGYEADVGAKTTIVMTNAHKMPAIVGEKIHLVIYCDQIPETLNTIDKVITRADVTLKFKSLNVLDNRFFSSLYKYTGKKPSTGMAAVFLGLNFCESVDLYGFGKDSKGEWDHYYTGETWNPNGFHAVDSEEKFLNRLAQEGFVKIHRGRR